MDKSGLVKVGTVTALVREQIRSRWDFRVLLPSSSSPESLNIRDIVDLFGNVNGWSPKTGNIRDFVWVMRIRIAGRFLRESSIISLDLLFTEAVFPKDPQGHLMPLSQPLIAQ
jgi:hypothetical protein